MHAPVGCFVGAMPPERFLEDFMKPAEALPPVPCADFSKVPFKGLVPDMCKAIVQAIERSKCCPGMRLFRTRTKTQWHTEVTTKPEHLESSAIGDSAGERVRYKFRYGQFPALAARLRPRPRKSAKRKVDIIESYDYSTAILDVEVHHRREADPFTDPHDDESSSSASQLSAASSSRTDPSSLPQLSSHDAPASQQLDKTFNSKPARSKSLVDSLNLGGPSRMPSQHETTPEPRQSPTRQKPQASSSSMGFYQLFENPAPESAAFRESLIAHAALQFTRNHRVFFLQVVIFDRWARFIRWDRSGAISTERFDYVMHPHILSEFFWRFSHLTDEQRGLDSTVTMVDLREQRLFKTAVQDFVRDMKAGVKNGVPTRRLPNAERMVEDTKGWPLWKVHITDSTQRESTELVIGRPLSDSCHVFGRATRAYIAYDLKQNHLVFLKDTWRIDHPKLLVESQTYGDLKKHNVPHVPNVLYGGDIQPEGKPLQETFTQVYAAVEDDWRITNYKYDRYIHHRIVQEIAYPIESSLHVMEFLQVLRDVLMAISEAYDKAGLLHRDLSIGNVMIDSNGRGILNDWDHAGKKNQLARGVGTWRFMSVPLLSDPDKLHDIADDLEGLFWVLLFAAMKLFALPGQDVPLYVFDWQGLDENGRKIGGSLKRHWIRHANRLDTFRFTSPILYNFIRDSQFVWLEFYFAVEDSISESSAEDSGETDTDALTTAANPTFWLDKYAAALRSLDDTRVFTPKIASSFGLEGNLGRTSLPAPAIPPVSPTYVTTPNKSPMRDLSNKSPSDSSRRKRPVEVDIEHNGPLTRSKRRKLGL